MRFVRTVGLFAMLVISAQISGLAQGTVYSPGGGVSLAHVTKEVRPEYTREAMAARIQGTVLVEAVVLADGTVGDVRVVQSLDRRYGLDDETVKATKQCLFEPGKKDGKPVAVRITMEHTFRLK